MFVWLCLISSLGFTWRYINTTSDACQNTEKTESYGSEFSLLNPLLCIAKYQFKAQTPTTYLPSTSKMWKTSKMAIFLVDLEFREKARALLTSKEIFFVLFFIFMALIPWVDVFNVLYGSFGGNATKFWQDFNEVHCNPKFAQLCPT